MPSPQRRINIELLLGISATFLSLAALVVSILQTKIAREQQQASVWPYLQIVESNIDQEFHYGLENKGVGPAIIKEYRLSYQGKPYSDLQALFLSQIGKRTSGGKSFGGVGAGAVFKPGESLDLLFVGRNDSVISQQKKCL